MKFYCLCILLLACYSSSARSGSDTNLLLIANPILRDSAALNKNTALYLTTDKDKYLTGEALWFNVFALNAQTLAPSNSDTNLLLLLKNEQNNHIVWSGCFQIQNTHGSGRIIIADSLPTGKYLLSAYTPHSFFKHQERIIAAKELIISGSYDTMKMANKPDTGLSDHINSRVQFDLLPEGGQLVYGLTNTLAFKAVAFNGSPINVDGMLTDNGRTVLRFQDDYAGMGHFRICPTIGHDYRVVLHYNGKDYSYALPPIQNRGTVLHLESNDRDSLVFSIAGNDTGNGRYYLRLQCRGALEKIAVIHKLKDSIKVRLPASDFLPGITEVTLIDSRLRPVAERLVYVHPEERLYIAVDTLKQQYGPKEKVTVKIHAQNAAGKPISALLLAKTTDSHFLNRESANTILPQMQLFSQLKGKIYNPEYYFRDTTPQSLSALDNLLLTQGWRAYQWNSDHLDKLATDTPVLYNRYRAWLLRENGKPNKKPVSIMAFNPFSPKVPGKRFTATDSMGYFDITPEMQSLGADYMIKYFTKDNQRLNIITRTDTNILTHIPYSRPLYETLEPVGNTNATEEKRDSAEHTEKVVVIKAKENYRNHYLAELDSLNYFDTPDRIFFTTGMLHGIYPVAEVEVHSRPIRHKNRYSNKEIISPTYLDKIWVLAPDEDITESTDSVLFDKFDLIELHGFITGKVFYSPDYDREDSTMEDNRNTLYWNPEIITDSGGNAVVSFFTSDVRGRFEIMVEGVAGNGLMGCGTRGFYVRKEERH